MTKKDASKCNEKTFCKDIYANHPKLKSLIGDFESLWLETNIGCLWSKQHESQGKNRNSGLHRMDMVAKFNDEKYAIIEAKVNPTPLDCFTALGQLMYYTYLFAVSTKKPIIVSPVFIANAIPQEFKDYLKSIFPEVACIEWELPLGQA